MRRQSPYEILGVSPDANATEIRTAFIRRAKVLHPDRFDKAKQADEWQMANDMLRDLNEAYASLKESPQEKSGIELSKEDKSLISFCFFVIRREKLVDEEQIQERLRIGKNQALFSVEYLERIGVISLPDEEGVRSILIDLETYRLPFDDHPPEPVPSPANMEPESKDSTHSSATSYVKMMRRLLYGGILLILGGLTLAALIGGILDSTLGGGWEDASDPTRGLGWWNRMGFWLAKALGLLAMLMGFTGFVCLMIWWHKFNEILREVTDYLTGAKNDG